MTRFGFLASPLSMRGNGWQAIWAFIATLAAVRTLGELFRHGWSNIVLLGVFCVAVSAGFALLARRRGSDPAPAPLARAARLPRRPADPIEPGRRFF